MGSHGRFVWVEDYSANSHILLFLVLRTAYAYCRLQTKKTKTIKWWDWHLWGISCQEALVSNDEAPLLTRCAYLVAWASTKIAKRSSIQAQHLKNRWSTRPMAWL